MLLTVDGIHDDLVLHNVAGEALGVDERDLWRGGGVVQLPWSLVMISTRSCC